MLPNDTPPSGGGLYLIWLSDEDEPHYYGGRTTCYARRWREHEVALQGGTHKNSRMQATFNKYGVFRVEAVPTDDDNIEAEQAWLDKHYGKPRCVNLSPHAVGGNIVEWTPERRKRRSERYMGHVRSEESRRRQAETIKSRPDLVEKARQSAARNRLPKGYKATPEHRANNAAAQRGKKQSPETIAKRAAAHRGRKNTPETIARMKAAAKRRVKEHGAPSHGADTRALISQQQRGRVWVNDGTTNRRVFPDEAVALLTAGWVRGRIVRNRTFTP